MKLLQDNVIFGQYYLLLNWYPATIQGEIVSDGMWNSKKKRYQGQQKSIHKNISTFEKNSMQVHIQQNGID